LTAGSDRERCSASARPKPEVTYSKGQLAPFIYERLVGMANEAQAKSVVQETKTDFGVHQVGLHFRQWRH
jgi:hypothetical protein